MRTQLTSSTAITAPVSVAELKTFARIDHNERDSELAIILDSVSERVEDVTRVAMVRREFVQTVYGLGNRRVELSRAPVVSITSVTDGATALTAGEDNDYVLKGDRIYLASLPDDELTITYTAGHAASDSLGDVPASLREQVLRYAATAQEFTTTIAADMSVTPIPPAVRSGLVQHMRVRA